MSGGSNGSGGGDNETLSSLPLSDSSDSSSRPPPPAVKELRLNERDKELLRQCREKSMQGAAPCAGIFAVSTYKAIGIGWLSPHPRFGSYFKGFLLWLLLLRLLFGVLTFSVS